MACPCCNPGASPELLALAEELEKRAATERIEYYEEHFSRASRDRPAAAPSERLLDVGCGNGYAVDGWSHAGRAAVGVDISFYRLRRWREEGMAGRVVLADARALPFRDASFDVVVSSGMIEHVGVDESILPYRVKRRPTRDVDRERVVAETLRVARGAAFVDCPNAWFPVDFWHGDAVGSFRIHSFDDELLPSPRHFRAWALASGASRRLCSLRGRFRFRQVGQHWWGRLLAPAMKLYLATLDLLVWLRLDAVVGRLVPYLVLEVRRNRIH